MIAMVTRAEVRLAKGRRNVFAAAALPPALADLAEVAPIIRGAVAVRSSAAPAEPKRFLLEFRGGREVLNYVNGADLADYGQRGVVTPDHIIRTKNYPLIASPAPGGQARRLPARLARSGGRLCRRGTTPCSRARTHASVAARASSIRCRAWCWCRDLGCSASAPRPRMRAIAADLAENAIRVTTDAEALGRFEPLPEADLFDVEYWSLEQAKLKGADEQGLHRPGGGRDRRRRRHRRGHGEGVCRRGSGGGRARPRPRRPRRRANDR